MKRAYLSSTAFTLALSPKKDSSLLMEQFFAQLFKAKFFSRTPQKDEVDMVVITDRGPVPVEIKIRTEIKERDLGPMVKFLKKHGLKEGYILC